VNGVVVPLDGSREAAQALALAEAIAAPRHLPVLLLEVVWKPGEWSQRYAGPLPSGPGLAQDPEAWATERARSHLTQVAAAHAGEATLDLDVRPGPPVDAILTAVEDTRAAFVCIATQTHAQAPGFARLAARFGLRLPAVRQVEREAPWVLHACVDELVRRSTVPVLVVPVAAETRDTPREA
jgi:nucleotide-binding universal stress UspA family protein